jgi:TonB family protein
VPSGFFRACEKNARSTISSLEKGNILLVGEDKDFLAQRGMINLVLANGKITYEVNSAALERAGIHYGATNATPNTSPGSSSLLTGGSRTLKTETAPEYPALVQQMNLKGAVQLQAVVRPDGSVKEVHVVGGHPMLAEAAVRAVTQSPYESAGKETVETVRISFGQ